MACSQQKFSRELPARFRTNVDIRDGVFDRMGQMLDQRLSALSQEETKLKYKRFHPAVKPHKGRGSDYKSAEDNAQSTSEKIPTPDSDLMTNW